MSNREVARQRTQMLTQVRAAHQDSVARTQLLLKEQKAVRRQICAVLREAPKTVPEIAAATGLSAERVLWHVTAMKKYELVREVMACGEYFTYEILKDNEK